jgi:riboflavin kinase/FMN adenylyltransferase
MDVIKYDDSLDLYIKNSIVSIGNYDGVHLGHQHILRELKKKSLANDSMSIVLTFEPHPKKFFSKDGDPFLLSTFDEKVNIIKSFGIDYLIYFEFNKEFASITADEFVRDILVKKFKADEIIVGYNFHFGKGRTGDPDFLRELGAEIGFGVTIVEPKKAGDEPISSSNIRTLIALGDVKKAAHFLGRNYSLTGKVIKGKDVGKDIGFPTVNIEVQGKLVPSDGVYSLFVTAAGKKLNGVANLGYQPTFGDNMHSIEAHILDFHEDMYDEVVTFEFVEKLRDEKKFSGAKELADQIRKDIEKAKESLSEAK